MSASTRREHGVPNASAGRFGIVVARFNEDVTRGLLAGARDVLAEAGVPDERIAVVHVPGAFEIPVTARRLAASGQFDAVICLGCLIKGDTMHFEYIASAASHGIMDAAADTGIPITFGVLTTLTEEQARARAADGPENKGREAALAAVEMAALWRALDAPDTEPMDELP
jgi:6,7-dimethyl-8-ribityllumazine synthase